MRRNLSMIATAAALLALPGSLFAQSIGPDSFGYVLTRTNNPGAFTTIAGVSGTVALTTNAMPHDDEAFTVNLPFNFSAYGTTYTQASPSTNGLIVLGGTRNTTFTNAALNTTLTGTLQTNALLCPAHFPGANAGYIKRRGDAFSIEWDKP